MLQKDLLLNSANSTEFVPTWHGASSQVNQSVKQVYIKNTPIEFIIYEIKCHKIFYLIIYFYLNELMSY